MFEEEEADVKCKKSHLSEGTQILSVTSNRSTLRWQIASADSAKQEKVFPTPTPPHINLDIHL